MAAGTTIKHKRKAGAFSSGHLEAGEFGVDTTSGLVYYSTDGEDILSLGGANSLYAERSYAEGGSIYDSFSTASNQLFMVARTAMTITRIDAEVDSTPYNPPIFQIIKNGSSFSSSITIDGGPNSDGNRHKSTAVSLSVAAGDRLTVSIVDAGDYMTADSAEGPMVIGIEFTRA
jgi:hypothetical protein